MRLKINPTAYDVEGNIWDSDAVFWPRCVWVDPGVVSGLSIVWFNPRAVLLNKPTPRCVLAWQETYVSGDENDQVLLIRELLSDLGGPYGLAVGCETFRAGRVSMDDDYLSPVRIRAMLHFAVTTDPIEDWDGIDRSRTLWGQSPSDAISTINDSRLKLWNMYTPGPDHIRDSTRHCLLWLRRLSKGGKGFLRRTHGYNKRWFGSGGSK